MVYVTNPIRRLRRLTASAACPAPDACSRRVNVKPRQASGEEESMVVIGPDNDNDNDNAGTGEFRYVQEPPGVETKKELGASKPLPSQPDLSSQVCTDLPTRSPSPSPSLSSASTARRKRRRIPQDSPSPSSSRKSWFWTRTCRTRWRFVGLACIRRS